MRAARFPGEGRVRIEDVPEPVAGADEAILRVTACALCGSDLRPLRAGWSCTPGHEIAGITTDGRRVLVYIPTFCGECAQCRAGRTNLCPTASLVGWQRDGGYAERVAVPARCLLPVPDDVPDRLAPLLLDTIGTTAHAIRQAAPLVAGGAALVVGAGPIGAGALIVLRRMGFAPLGVCEPNTGRAAFAATLGATVLDPTEAAGFAPALVVEASGKDAGRQLALDAVAPGGAVLQLGESDAWNVTETRGIRRKDFAILRSFYFPIGDYDANLALLRADRDDYARLVSCTDALENLDALFARFARGELIKPLACPV